MNGCQRILAILITFTITSSPAGAEDGDAGRGQRVFRACAACHALTLDRHMTGPSLAELWSRKAGSLPGFTRYSAALKSSGIIWDDASLDAYVSDPEQFVPGTAMTFAGIKDARQRADLLAFLKDATRPGSAAQLVQPPGGMGGMMGGGQAPNLKSLTPDMRVQAIRLCRDTYRVTTADGRTRDFWERNLRLKTDSSNDGPVKGAPGILAAGMMGDRASVIFAEPEEIGRFVSQGC